MKRKARLHKKYTLQRKAIKLSKGNVLTITCLLVILCVFFVFHWASSVLTPKLEAYAEAELHRFSALIINKMIVKEINDTISIEDLFIVSKDSSDSIHTVDFNPIAVNRLLSIITNSIQTDFQNLEQGNYEDLNLEDNALSDFDMDLLKRGIVFTIPSGMVFDNPLLSNLGPKIPVRFSLTGDITSKINTKITNYGINNAMVEVNADVTIRERMILPFLTKDIEITVSVPIVMKLIQGTVPDYYFNGIDKNSNIVTVPIQ